MGSNGTDLLEVPQVSGKLPSLSSKKSADSVNNEASEQRPMAPQILNAYSLNPRTVPPFALDSNCNESGPSNSQLLKKHQYKLMFKDTFLMSHSDKWSEFLQNAGSNPSYTSRVLLDASESREGHSSEQRGRIVNDSSSSSSSSTEGPVETLEKKKSSFETGRNGIRATADLGQNSYNEQDEIDRVREEILQDLNGDWEGGKRLEAIFNAPIPGNYEMRNQKDRNEWLKYVAQLKAFYYLKNESIDMGVEPKEHQDDAGVVHSMVHRGRDVFDNKKNSWAMLERKKKQQWLPRLRRLLLQSQYLPLSLRLIIGVLCIVSLALATRIYQNSDSTISSVDSSIPQQPSTIMALCVNSIAIVYLVYIGYDEFSGKPLGIRDPMAKVRLIMLDLLFIIFSSANLSLTFNTLYDSRWVCTSADVSKQSLPPVAYICRKQRALAAFLFLVLVAWVLTFSISILRVVERVSSGAPKL